MRILILVILLMHYGKTTGFAEAYERADEVSGNKVFIITLDGFRWQEVFRGADPELLKSTDTSAGQFSGAGADARRRQLLPFLWSKVAAEGQLSGNRHKGSKMGITNPYALSYAGYNELFTGSPDLFIWNNGKRTNSNRTVFSFLAAQPRFKGKIASITSWPTFAFILNKGHGGVYINSGTDESKTEAIRRDEETFAVACNYIAQHKPQLLHLGFSGTDEAGHRNDYGAYLQQAHLADKLIESLWNKVQSMPFYRGQTTFIITTDHGRGGSPHNWHQHGFFVPGSSQTWLALLGNGIKPSGESSQPERLYGTQIAGTIALLLRANGYKPYALPGTKFEKISAIN